MDLTGQTLNQYQIREQIGHGGMAQVYKAYQPNLERYVAVKVLYAPQADDPDLKERFAREAKAIAQLSHPNILPIYDVGSAGEITYFVMKYVPGGQTLKSLLGQPLELATVGHYIEQIANALDHAHEHKILHRDIKPANILLEHNWLLLADFGLARTGLESQLTTQGAVVGTPQYMAPEQAEGETVDYRADIYSLGVVLYEMIMGHVPYDAESPLAILYKHIHDPVPRPRRYRRDLSAGLEAVILRALAKEPANRFARAGALAEALRAQLESSPLAGVEGIRQGIPPRIFLWFQSNALPDQQLAAYLQNLLRQSGHVVSADPVTHTDEAWLAEIDPKIESADFLIVLLSPSSLENQMGLDVLKQGLVHHKQQKRPHILPVQIGRLAMPPAGEAYLTSLPRIIWQNETDNDQVGQAILAATTARGSASTTSLPLGIISEDGGTFTDDEAIHTPLPQFDPGLVESLEAPGGVIKLRDKFYIERYADAQLRREVTKAGTTTTIRASRQTGKSSLLVRGINFARENKARVFHLDLQQFDAERLATPNIFLHSLAELMVRKLRLEVAEVENFWRGSLGPQDKLTYLIEDYILPETNSPIVLALDEVDRLLQTTNFYSDFFALLRAWHNSRALNEDWNRFNIILVISTEPYLLINEINQSPFNVGLRVYLEDFNQAQVRDLNQRHGAPVAEADFPELMDLLNGQPYLTRQALYTMVIQQLTWANLRQIAVEDNGPFGDHLRRQHWLLGQEPMLKEAFRQVIHNKNCEDDTARFRLLQAGLIKGSGDVYACRCDLYRQYFKDKL
ncbi:MAG: AAA-like domain-containing protein [Anaerolineae bacterium]|nr:AAA-like domain-containing protein [Anaerolineae bacterium]